MPTNEVRSIPANGIRPWASGDDTHGAASLADFQEGLPVRLIATPRSAFRVCRRDEALPDVVARNLDNYDYFPVVEPDGPTSGQIIGLVQLVPFMRGETPLGIVANVMQPLSEANLIGADASLLAFIRSADRQSCRLVVSGPEINGLVSLSDLQRLPVRAALFAMVTHLEITMAQAIRREIGDSDDWLKRLSPGRRDKVRREVAEAKSQDSFVDALLFTQFCDKVAVLRKSQNFRWGKAVFDREMARIKSLRDDLAHANNYASTRESAASVCNLVRRMDYWIDELIRPTPPP